MLQFDFSPHAFARTRVARRIVLLFVLCAIVPVASLAGISYVSVSNQLRERAADRLYQGSRSVGMALMQRLQNLEWELGRLAARVPLAERARRAGRWEVPEDGAHFTAIAFSGPGAGAPRVPELDSSAHGHLRSGRAVVFAEPGPRGFPRVLMAMLPDTADPGTVLWAELDPGLWGPPITTDAMPEQELCIVRGDAEAVFCPPRTAPRILGAMAGREGADITFEWESEDGPWLAASWPLFMRYYFQGPDWKIISSEARSAVLAPLSDFTRGYTLVLAASLVLVALLSLVTIRRNMDPLADLHAATRRIAAQDFDTRVEVKSRDEFRALADSFNAMAEALGRQFRALDGMAGLGQRLLATRDTGSVAGAALEEVRKVVHCRAAALLFRSGFDGRPDAGGWIHDGEGVRPSGPWDAAAVTRLFEDPSFQAIPAIGSGPGPLPEPLTSLGAATHLLFPIRINAGVAGAFVFGIDRDLGTEDVQLARQLCDSVAVALTGACVLTELNDLSWGALRALARAIDAKSAWTAGHSDRVTALAVALGRRLGLDAVQLERLERGGLLHDVGKIGVSSDILDKAGPLTAEEWEKMRAHTTAGGRILEPIARYADILPIVVHHHERWDGGGYPHHLVGEAIPYLARVLAVADVYDALTSDRPYRASLTPARAVSMIEAGLGTQFDPVVGRLFARMMRDSESREPLRAAPLSVSRLMAAAVKSGSGTSS